MTFDVITIFPEFFRGILEHGLLKRAAASGHVSIRLRDLRDYTDDRHRTVDDRPFGGGPGMVFKPEPIFRVVEALRAEAGAVAAPGGHPEAARELREENFQVILLSPQGRLLRQSVVEELACASRLALICGRYEGVDERVAEHLASQEISIGDFVLSGGELAAAIVMEAVTRLVPGVLGNEESCQQDSFSLPAGSSAEVRHGLLDCPHYTRPAELRGWKVPEVLLSGNHEEIRAWRRRRALEKTWRRRPDLLAEFPLDRQERDWLESLKIGETEHECARKS